MPRFLVRMVEDYEQQWADGPTRHHIDQITDEFPTREQAEARIAEMRASGNYDGCEFSVVETE